MAKRATKTPSPSTPSADAIARTVGKIYSTPSAEAIARTLREVYRGPAWYGPSVRSALKGVDAAKAEWRPAPGRNCIHDLVLHLIYVRHRMLGRLTSLQGGRGPRFPRAMRLTWFPEGPERLDEATWKEDVRLLDEYQSKVLDALGEADSVGRSRRRSGKTRTLGDELMGMAFHDAYHAGQIRLLALLAPDK